MIRLSVEIHVEDHPLIFILPINMPRISQSPELLKISGKTYDYSSACARTFLFAGKVVVWSHSPHIDIINGLMCMSGPCDKKTMKRYGFEISGKLTQADLDHFRENWSGTLGDTRRQNKAGRAWLQVPDDNGNLVNVISFWANRESIDDEDLQKLKITLKIKGGSWLDWDNCEESVWTDAIS